MYYSSGLDSALRRISSIESDLQRMAGVSSLQEVKSHPIDASENKEFQEALNSAVQKIKPQPAEEKTEQTPSAEKPKDINSLIKEHAAKQGLDASLVKAVIKQESGFNPSATSPVGAMGLMQLMPGTAKELGVQNAYDPEENISGGTAYLKKMLNKFDNDPKMALAAYNAGPGAVSKFGGVPPYKETQNYIQNVLKSYDTYKKEVGGGA
ncbi:soluble lytic murein transglycosylase [Candidatus Gastranaerophilus sp. (ex Termes propinquus)]|nr:soluble lytic murein transglycosylase [Candidatus Gastranaerophilus sp. (ex Termes propinquus)]